MHDRRPSVPAPSTDRVTAPATACQRYILDQDTDPSCDDAMRRMWILAHAVQVAAGVDLRRLRRAAEKLSKQHDSLRMRFHRLGGDWQAVVAGGGEASGFPLVYDAAGHDAADISALADAICTRAELRRCRPGRLVEDARAYRSC